MTTFHDSQVAVHLLSERRTISVSADCWLSALETVGRDDAAVVIPSPHHHYPDAVAAVRLTAGRQSFVLCDDADHALREMSNCVQEAQGVA